MPVTFHDRNLRGTVQQHTSSSGTCCRAAVPPARTVPLPEAHDTAHDDHKVRQSVFALERMLVGGRARPYPGAVLRLCRGAQSQRIGMLEAILCEERPDCWTSAHLLGINSTCGRGLRPSRSEQPAATRSPPARGVQNLAGATDTGTAPLEFVRRVHLCDNAGRSAR
jgi:hypothetical protein